MMTRYRCTLLRAGRLLLDGGGMFGVIPKVVWSRFAACDDKNRIEIHHNCLLLESESSDPKLGRPRRVLIEAGTGDKLDAKMSTIFGLDGRTVETALSEHHVDPEEIDHAIVSHLHFDHAGGLTRRVREGESADWTAAEGQASGDDPRVKLTLPNAELIVQRREWVDAIANDAVMTKTYYPDHLLPFVDPELELRGHTPRLRLVDSPAPFAATHKPSRNQHPGKLSVRTTEVLPGIHVFLVPGHTWGQQAIMFTNTDGQTVCFVPDVLPTHYHAGQTFSLSYDVEPYTSMVTKGWLLAEAAANDWLLMLDHEPGNPWRRVQPKGAWFELIDPA